MLVARWREKTREALERSLLWGWVLRPEALEASLHLSLVSLPFLPPEVLLPISLLPLLFLAARWVAGHRVRATRTPLDLPVAAYFALAILATVTSVDPRGSLRDLAIYTCAFALFLVITDLDDPRVTRRLIFTLLLTATVVALYGIYQYFVVPPTRNWYDPKTNPELRVRVYSTFGNPNILAEYLGLVAPFGLARVMSARRGTAVAWAGVTAVIFACLLLTYSRGGWIGAAVALAVFMVLEEPRAAWLLAAGALAGYLVAPPAVVDRLLSMVSLKDSSNAHRLGVWLASLAMLKELWPTGVGLGHRAFMRVYAEFRLRGRVAWHSHNLFMEQALELGVLGLAAFLWIVFTFYTTASRFLRGQGGRGSPAAPSRHVVMAGVASLTGALFQGLVENVLYMAPITLTFWTVVALTVSQTMAAADGGQPGGQPGRKALRPGEAHGCTG
ncbi:MAG: O-antigen ligase family protein [Bacillota bacterium]